MTIFPTATVPRAGMRENLCAKWQILHDCIFNPGAGSAPCRRTPRLPQSIVSELIPYLRLLYLACPSFLILCEIRRFADPTQSNQP